MGLNFFIYLLGAVVDVVEDLYVFFSFSMVNYMNIYK